MGAEGRQFLEIMVAKAGVPSLSRKVFSTSLRTSPPPPHQLPARASSSKDSGDPSQHGREAPWFGPGRQLAVLIREGEYYFSVVASETNGGTFYLPLLCVQVYEGYHVFKTSLYLGSRRWWHVSGEKREVKKLKGETQK